MNDLNHGIILETPIQTLKLEAFFTMTAAKTAAAMAVGLLTTLSVASFAQNGQDQPAAADPTANATALVLSELATVDWIDKSDVAALREGVIEKMELRLGDPALVSKPIGYLHRDAAELTVAKNKIMAESVGAIEKGKAAVEVAASRVARDKRLNDRKPGMVSAEDVAKDEGELKVADAQTKEAMENQHAAEAELALAREILKEHTIVAPFDSVKATLTCQTAKITKSSQHFRSSGPFANRWKRNGAGFLAIAAFYQISIIYTRAAKGDPNR